MSLQLFAGHVETMRCLWLSQPGVDAPGKEPGNSLGPCSLTKCETWPGVVTMSKAHAEVVGADWLCHRAARCKSNWGHKKTCLTMHHYPLPGIPIVLPSFSGSALCCFLYLTGWEKCLVSDGTDSARLLIPVLSSIRSRDVVSVLMNSLMSLQTISLFKPSVSVGLC